LNPLPDIPDGKWPEIVDRLTLHAVYKLRNLAWRGVSWRRGGRPPGGIEPADIAADAIVSVIAGERTWNQTKQPCFLTFLKGIVDSKVSHLVESCDNRVSVRLTYRTDQDDCPCSGKNDQRPPDDIVADGELTAKFRAEMFAAVEGDQLAAQLFECFDADITNRSEIAEMLGVSVADVDNARKRLARRVEKAHKQYLRQTRKGHE
jgi:DNA-directed RNA polymerase specialized sigma24 family protein